MPWLRHQGRALAHSLGWLIAQPLRHALYVAVGSALLAMGLLAGLVALNVQPWAQHQLPEPKLILFMSGHASEAQTHAVWEALATNAEIQSFDTRSPDDALSTLRAIPALQPSLAQLTHNPLGTTFILHLRHPDVAHFTTLEQDLANLPGVAQQHSDKTWSARIHGFLYVTQRMAGLVSGLSLLSMFILFHGLARQRFLGQNRARQLLFQLGATSHQIARPYTYYGLLLGFLSALGALLWLYGLWRAYQSMVPLAQGDYPFSLDSSFLSPLLSFWLITSTPLMMAVLFRIGKGNSR